MSLKEINQTSCPICNKGFPVDAIETHVDKCLFLKSENECTAKRQYPDDFVSKSPKVFNKKSRSSKANEPIPSTSTLPHYDYHSSANGSHTEVSHLHPFLCHSCQ